MPSGNWFRAHVEMEVREGLEYICARSGAYAGLLLFALFGIFKGSQIGNLAGVKLAGVVFGLHGPASGLPLMMINTFTLLGVAAAAVLLVGCFFLAGWASGRAASSVLRWLSNQKSLSPGLREAGHKPS